MTELFLQFAHKKVLACLIGGCTDEDEMLLWFNPIHTHRIDLAEPCIADSPDLTALAPATQRVAWHALAELWGDREDKERTAPEHWYWLYAHRYDSRAEVLAEGGRSRGASKDARS